VFFATIVKANRQRVEENGPRNRQISPDSLAEKRLFSRFNSVWPTI